MQAIYFDMDGTLADLYNVQDWERKLNSGDESPYIEALPLCDMQELNDICEQFAKAGIIIGVISWLAKNSDRYYDARVRQAKKDWLANNFPCASEVHIVRYGTTKLACANIKDAMLVDDNIQVLSGWNGGAVLHANKKMLKNLKKLLDTIL